MPSLTLKLIFRVTCSQRRESASDRQRDQSLTFNDPLWPMQWELGEYNCSGVDLNVMPVWMNNVTGAGVVVSIIDDGESNTLPL
ncbi:Kexin [Liparis tanakae]|uniref:Kexin n=1 Tax=Liparis tanakae TaxID=230148 RepID=A0A4Z2F9F1_9TELE|nr:Kexin [Liparis tanakae]